ncbi:Pre-mRNA-splicing factor CLF1 [Corchorus olitorius]|uniref:Pre-mRNA-splicing factor CLF1 n=1 Tax=Corchorus olitorius TaxID=93759 RepID=A0A1R3IB83_9ROSI|nr:Pre-mRNA-splicing factor CLF1 [Corchorus olitorius]
MAALHDLKTKILEAEFMCNVQGLLKLEEKIWVKNMRRSAEVFHECFEVGIAELKRICLEVLGPQLNPAAIRELYAGAVFLYRRYMKECKGVLSGLPHSKMKKFTYLLCISLASKFDSRVLELTSGAISIEELTAKMNTEIGTGLTADELTTRQFTLSRCVDQGALLEVGYLGHMLRTMESNGLTNQEVESLLMISSLRLIHFCDAPAMANFRPSIIAATTFLMAIGEIQLEGPAKVLKNCINGFAEKDKLQ